MATCKDCLHVEVCDSRCPDPNNERLICDNYKDRSHFVELPTARKIKHTPDFEKMRYFHKLGFGEGMNERSVFWTCSNCGMWASLAHKFCSNCGAKFEAEQALKERENDGK